VPFSNRNFTCCGTHVNLKERNRETRKYFIIMRANEKEKKKKRTSSYETKTYFYQKKVGLTTGKFSI